MTTPVGRPVTGARRRRVLALLAGALLVLLPALPAQAHDRLSTTAPADGATVAAAPTSVVLTFEEPAVALGSKVLVTGPGGAVVSTGDPQFVDDTVTQQLTGDLPAGTYRVEWRVTSDDGHPVSGTFTYTASGPAAATATSPSTSPPANPSTSPSTSDAPAPTSTPVDSSAVSASSSGTPGWLVVVGAVVVLALLAAVAAAVLRRRR